MLEAEQIEEPSALMHIGDNFESDYKAALKHGMTAVYYPSLWDLLFQKGSPWTDEALQHFTDDPMQELLIGYAFVNACLSGDALIGEKRFFPTMGEFADLLLAPTVSAIALYIRNDPRIQENYSRIHFAARDGYLPKMVYDILAEGSDARPSNYLYVSRQSLSFTAFDGFFDWLGKSVWQSEEYPLENFLRLFITDHTLCDQIVRGLHEQDKQLDLRKHPADCQSFLMQYQEELEAYFQKQKIYGTQYYLDRLGQGKQEKSFLIAGTAALSPPA